MRAACVALGVSAAMVASVRPVRRRALGGGGASAAGADQADEAATSSVAVARQDLVARTEVDGTLGYSGELKVAGQGPGTVTAVPKPGAVVDRGQSLYSVDNRPVTLLFGDLPAWRRLAAGMADGPDVKQLEQNLIALGHATEAELAVDEKFTAATTTAVKRWQKALGLEETGVVELGQAVFLPGAFRVAEVKAEKGSSAPPGLARHDRDLDQPRRAGRPRRHQAVAGQGGREGRREAARRQGHARAPSRRSARWPRPRARATRPSGWWR